MRSVAVPQDLDSVPEVARKIIAPVRHRFPCMVLLLAILVSACTTTTSPTQPSELGAIDTLLPTATSLPPTLTPAATPTPTVAATPLPTWTPTAEPISLPAFEPSACRFGFTSPVTVECGDLIVPENRRKPDSPPIRVHVAIFKSTSPNPKPDPVIYVAGGGGADQLGATDTFMDWVGNAILQERDFIMYNQRGSHRNEPSLVCPDLTGLYFELAAQDLSAHERADRRIERRLECHDDLLARGIDLTGYNTVETAADISDLRRVLGLENVNLYGTSSGTRTILAVMHYHPEGIRSVILDSVFPPQVNYYSTFGLSVNRVFSLLFDACAADADCSQRYPDLEEAFYQLVDDLNAHPASVELSRGTIPVTGDMFMYAMWWSFYSANQIALVPGRIHWARQGVFTGMVPWLENTLSDSGTFMAEGVEWSLMCNEEAPFESYELGRELAADLPPQIAAYFDSYYEFTLCEAWQSGRADPVENTAVVSDIPALVLAGGYDPVTPPEWSRLAAETLSAAHYYEFPSLTHGVMRSNACGLEIGLHFLDDPRAEPDSACMDDLPALDIK
jgi:pimeloyl-ACP methyl ester carboxylesterase